MDVTAQWRFPAPSRCAGQLSIGYLIAPTSEVTMNPLHAQRITSHLPQEALVLDVGGGMAAFPRADWVIDAVDFEERGRLLDPSQVNSAHRFTKDSWVRFDICSRQPWPFRDEQFDFAVCSHVLEDVRDPVWVCSEISRIAKAGYVEVPSRIVEQSKGVEHPRLAGYYHHRWLISVVDGALEFRQKPHLLHVTSKAIVAKVGFWRDINPAHAITTHDWQGELNCHEVLEFDEQNVVEELCQYSHRAQRIPQLLVPPQLPFGKRIRKAVYSLRQTWS